MELTTTASFKFAKDMIPKLVKKLFSISAERDVQQERLVDVFGDPAKWAPYYIEPYCQQFNPADEDDESRHVVRELLTSRLQHFLGGSTAIGSPHLLILADSGMGKTSCLIMLKLAHIKAFWPKTYKVHLLKLGKNTLDEIKVLEKRKGILLLDALDEDPMAWGRVDQRLTEILSATKHFDRVIITCRTQFFSADEDPFDRRGQVEVGGFLCPVIFLSLFDEWQVEEYLRRRFPGDKTKVSQARSMVLQMKGLKFRPMMLTHIDKLIESESTQWTMFSIYQAMVQVWLNRERAKMADQRTVAEVPSLSDLHRACMILSRLMFRSGSTTVSIEEISNAVSFNAELAYISEIDIAGRSLLNKNSAGEYRFAHLSVQEFLFSQIVAQGLLAISRAGEYKPTTQVMQFLDYQIRAMSKEQRRSLKLGYLEMAGLKLVEMDWNHVNLDNLRIRNSVMSTANASQASFANAEMERSEFFESRFSASNFEASEFEGMRIEGCDFSDCVFVGATLKSTSFEDTVLANCQFEGAEIASLKFRRCQFPDASFLGAKLTDVEFDQCHFDEATFRAAKLVRCKFTACKLARSDFSQSNADNSDLGLCELPEGVTPKMKRRANSRS